MEKVAEMFRHVIDLTPGQFFVKYGWIGLLAAGVSAAILKFRK
ncbi:hypothetical protein ACFOQM_23215 [Paenibacillus sp. GCM10012307]|nr:hypothetical protein [Paenibacillus roseus]